MEPLNAPPNSNIRLFTNVKPIQIKRIPWPWAPSDVPGFTKPLEGKKDWSFLIDFNCFFDWNRYELDNGILPINCTMNFRSLFTTVCRAYGIEATLECLQRSNREIELAFWCVQEAFRNFLKTLLDSCPYEISYVIVGDDIAFNNALMFSPKSWYFRYLKNIIEPAVSRGIPCIFHSDGDISLAIPFLKEIGFSLTIFQPIGNMIAFKEKHGSFGISNLEIGSL